MNNFLTGIRKIEYIDPVSAGILEIPGEEGKVAHVGGNFSSIRILAPASLSQSYDPTTSLYEVELTFSVMFLSTPSALKYANKVYRVTDMHDNQFLIGGRHTPYPQAEIQDDLPESVTSPRKTVVTISLVSPDGVIRVV